MAKVIFLHLSVIHSVHRGGGLPQCILGYHHPPADTPRSRHPPGPDPPNQTRRGIHPPPQVIHTQPRTRPPGADTHPPRSYTHSPGPDPQEQTPPRPDPPPRGSRVQQTVYERPVRILLECILVLFRCLWAYAYSFYNF